MVNGFNYPLQKTKWKVEREEFLNERSEFRNSGEDSSGAVFVLKLNMVMAL